MFNNKNSSVNAGKGFNYVARNNSAQGQSHPSIPANPTISIINNNIITNPNITTTTNTSPIINSVTTTNNINSVTTTNNTNSVASNIISTAMILVRDSTGTYRLGRALLDSYSQVNFVTDSFAQKLRLKREKHVVQISSIGHARTEITSLTTISIRSRLSPFEVSLDLCVTSHIAYQPDINIDISRWKMPQNIVLAGEKFYQSRHIDMLLGTEAFFDILSVGQVKLDITGPMLQKTLFCWVVTGKCHPQQSREIAASFKLGATSIDDHLKRLWEIESIETSNVLLKPEHRACEEHYLKTTVTNDSGRIVVRLPFKNNPSQLGHSFDIARRRFLSLERRLAQSSGLRLQYCQFMEEYEHLEYMSLVTEPHLSEPHYYIPHHCVLKPVFDVSLHRYAITVDVNVDLNDRKYQYILWRALPDEPLRTYQLNTVTYGTASAPYLTIRSLHYLANLCRTEYPIGAVIESSFYVDDLLSGGEDIETLRTIKDQVTKILHRGHFPLSKWHSNHAQFIENFAIKDINTCDNGLTSALGVSWNQHTDMLLFHSVNCISVVRPSRTSVTTHNRRKDNPTGALDCRAYLGRIGTTAS
ncbi:uncharacterized protein LOC122322804 [Drosophila grimshawi]|uniref:uncharacterized protein LOC122322804 n=1 Tax=Drosophila grimshawi TaxID=7222 RepID=UPI001C9369D1|nr:uncharacterized protein LOC122322804 [Drosophila grimshawi]